VLTRRPPSTPGRLFATTCEDGIRVTVHWTVPEDTGGADITGYVIKYGDRDTDVDHYDELPVDGTTTHYQFTDPKSNWTSYRFAVAAENAAGRGEFSEFLDGEHSFYYSNTECSRKPEPQF